MKNTTIKVVSSLLAGVALILACAAPGHAQYAYGEQFLVSDLALANNPSVAMDHQGNFVVAWSAPPAGTSLPLIWARLFWSDGTPRSDAIQVNTYSMRRLPQVSMARDGRFVVVWVSEVGQLVKARTFEADGTPIIDTFDVSDKTIGLYERPVDVAMADDGDFVVVWDSDDSTDPSADMYDILARRFAIDGTPLSAEMQVNTQAVDIQKHPRVAINYAGGRWAVVWESNGFAGGDQSLTCVVARIFENDIPEGPDFQVNQTTSGNQRDPSVDLNTDNDLHLVIAWESEVSGGDYGIFARRYLTSGDPVEDEQRLDQWPYGFWVYQQDPVVGLSSQRDVVVAWQSWVTRWGDDPDRCIEGRQLLGDGTLVDEFQVNTTGTSNQAEPDLAVNDRGDYVVVWSDANGIWGRRFLIVEEIFFDGFESGNDSAWSAGAP